MMQRTMSFTFIMALLLLANFVGCSTRVGSGAVEKYNANPLTVAIPEGLSEEQVESVMKQTLTARGWQVTQASPQQTDGALQHRSFDAKVSLMADDGVIRILSDSQHISGDTGDKQPGVPRGWLDNLQKDLNKRLAAASRQP